ncbi:hypothetical protein F5884DRAFT_800295 [Xylogone sp. PMI_703]|nr:hypothetical protein F5884DRAFT_800295 [Xylogone sp. PMI_703]
MPKVLSYTPAWLSKPSPGYDLFTSTSKASNAHAHAPYGSIGQNKKDGKPGPRRTIVHRGTEVFVAVGKEIHWADLALLKEAWEARQQSVKSRKSRAASAREDSYEGDHLPDYKTIKIPVADDIKQLVISPQANYLAIATTHTVHIAVLPESSHLTAPDTGPIRLKTYTLGPTTHVTSQSALASAIWHPLGVNGSCLVTVTTDAIVRIWELSTADRWSFDRPTLAIDLKKLADGTSVDQDFGASVAMSKGFSPDSFEMEVASACFPSRESGGWSPMTLWIAMREGDVYALCPLLPEKWSPPPTLIPSLSISIVSKVATIEDDPEVSQKAKLLAQQQLAWMSDIDNQDPMHLEGTIDEPPAEVFTRPSKPGRVPRLQGPFEFELAPEESEDELDSLLSDIYVIGPKTDTEELMLGEEEDIEVEEVGEEGLSLGVICLLTSSGRLSICLDLDGVEAQWLPQRKSKALWFSEEEDDPSLLTFQVLDTSRSGEVWQGSWPMFTPDIKSRYSFYITDTQSVSFVSLSPWVSRLETEMDEGTAGTDFRIDLLVKNQGSIRERLYTEKGDDRSAPLSASVVINSSDLGYFLLSATPYAPVALSFDSPEYDIDSFERAESPVYDVEPDKPLILCEPRPVYQPSHALDGRSALPVLLERLQHSKYKRLMKEDVRLSPATLTIMTDAHKILSEETHRIGAAAAELFRRCERLQTELRNQIKKANDVACRVEAVTGDDTDEGPTVGMNELLEKRIDDAKERQKDIAERLERMRKKVSRGITRELSDKEKAWVEEVFELQDSISTKGVDNQRPGSRSAQKTLMDRYEEVQHLEKELVGQANEIAESQKEEPQEEEKISSTDLNVPSEIRKAKVTQIKALLDREAALIDGAKSRLERLNISE